MAPALFSWVFVFHAILGGTIQMLVIYFMRSKNFSFLMLIPFILISQWLFISAYAKAPNFTVQWFITAGLTGMASVLFGAFMFGDNLNWNHYLGVVLVFIGLSLLMIK